MFSTNMFDWLSRWMYRRKVFAALVELSGAGNRGLAREVLANYPLADTAIRIQHKAGDAPEEVAVGIMAFVYPDAIVAFLPAEHRKLVFSQLQEIHDKGEITIGTADYITLTFQMMTAVTERWLKETRLKESTREILLVEFLGALAGRDRDERMRARIQSANAKP